MLRLPDGRNTNPALAALVKGMAAMAARYRQWASKASGEQAQTFVELADGMDESVAELEQIIRRRIGKKSLTKREERS